MIDGVIMVVDNYARRMSEYADVTVFAPNCGDFDFDALPYKVVLCKALSVPHYDYSLPLANVDMEFRRKLSESELDIVHIHSPAFIGKAGMRYAEQHGIPAVATLHSQLKTDYRQLFKTEALANFVLRDTTSLYDRADECWAVNSAMAALYTREYGGRSQPLVLSNATDLLPCPNPEKSRRKINGMFGIGDGEKVLLYVGRLDTLKNIILIVEAVKLLKESRKFPFRMLFVGSGKDEALLRKETERLGLQDEVVLCGRISDRELLAEIYSRAELFVFPSLYDASSLVQIEAASQKTPAVFIRDSVTSATVKENVNGFCCGNSKQALADKITEIFGNPDLYADVAKNAFRDLYVTWDVSIDKAYRRYCGLLETRHCVKACLPESS